MRYRLDSVLRAAALAATILGLVLIALNPPELAGLGDAVTLFAAAVAIALVTAWGIVAVAGREMPERDFRKLEERSDLLAAMPAPDYPPSEFDELVMAAIDELPDEFRALLRDTPVIVSHLGREHRAYGHYMGGTVARNAYADKIVIYQDTLERDFGHDPALLRAQVARVVRHELAHHLGWDEPGVRNLGL
jgi:predicted Zn-dependent protease with MMP-like domain